MVDVAFDGFPGVNHLSFDLISHYIQLTNS